MDAPIVIFITLYIFAFLSIHTANTEQITNNLNKVLNAENSHDLGVFIRKYNHALLYLYKDQCASSSCQHSLDTVISAASQQSNDFQVIHSDSKEVHSEYAVTSGPKLIYFRKSNPISYEGSLQDPDELDEWLAMNSEPSVTQLNDDDFEHLTQAATGSTTGDWFILFYRPSCQTILSLWEAVASRLKGRIIVAKVDLSSNPGLKDRFEIKGCPSLIFFRLGKMYTYTQSHHDYSALVAFPEGWYRNVKSTNVPVPPSPFDSFTDQVVSSLKDLLSSPLGRLSFVALCVGFLLFMGFIIFCLLDTSKPKLD